MRRARAMFTEFGLYACISNTFGDYAEGQAVAIADIDTGGNFFEIHTLWDGSNSTIFGGGLRSFQVGPVSEADVKSGSVISFGSRESAQELADMYNGKAFALSVEWVQS
jgi:hypothetical protein